MVKKSNILKVIWIYWTLIQPLMHSKYRKAFQWSDMQKCTCKEHICVYVCGFGCVRVCGCVWACKQQKWMMMWVKIYRLIINFSDIQHNQNKSWKLDISKLALKNKDTAKWAAVMTNVCACVRAVSLWKRKRKRGRMQMCYLIAEWTICVFRFIILCL